MPSFLDYLLLTVITIFPVLSLGIMLFFSFAVAPTIFKILPPKEAGLYIRKLFPIYYIINSVLILCSIISIASLGFFNTIFFTNLMVLILFAVCFFYLMPEINKQKNKTSRKFKILHSSSVIINFVQIFALIAVTAILLDF